MHHLGRLVAAFALVLAGGCTKLDSFNCLQSSECQNGDVLGSCEPGGVCSFPDPACASGKKYGDLAGELSGLCVGEGGTGTTTPDLPTSSTSSSTDVTATTLELTSTSFDPTSTTATSEVTATTTVTLTDPTTTSDDTTTGATCGQVGEACVDGACCGGCTKCDGDDTCVPLDAIEGAEVCGVCSFCGGDGECAPSAADSECPADCGDFVWGEKAVNTVRTACYGYAPKQVVSHCDGSGACLPLDPVAACPDPEKDLTLAVKLAECDTVCLENEGFCTPGAPAAEATMDSYCLLRSASDMCQSTCSVDETSLEVRTCVGGVCTDVETQSCGGYLCDAEMNVCLVACDVDTDCTGLGKCVDMMCM